MTSKTLFSKTEVYETPAVEVLNVTVEGVLCQSGELDILDWETDDDSIVF